MSADQELADYVAMIRADGEQERTRRQAAEQQLADLQAEQANRKDALAAALGLKPDPAKLASELRTTQAKATADLAERDRLIRESQVEAAVLRAAAQVGADPDLLLDSRAFMAKVSRLDPSSSDFAAQLAAEVKATGRTPAPSTQQRGEGPRQWTREEAVAIAKSDPKALQQAIDDGLLTSIGYPPSRKRGQG